MYERECAAFPHRHFERKREIFFVRGQAKEARMTDHGKHRTLCGVESRCFMQTALRRKTETANEKDPSTALGMTIRERAVSHSLSSRGGSEPPPLRGTSFRGKEGVCRLLASSFRAKARNLFRLRSDKHCEEEDHGKHRTSYDLGRRREYAAFPHRHSRLPTTSFFWMSQAGIIAASVPITVIKGMIRSPRGSGAVSITTAA